MKIIVFSRMHIFKSVYTHGQIHESIYFTISSDYINIIQAATPTKKFHNSGAILKTQVTAQRHMTTTSGGHITATSTPCQSDMKAI